MGRGIDYGMGQTNVGKDGIRFGVINMNDLSQWAWEDVESDYGEPTCGHCGNEVTDDIPEDSPDQTGEYWCAHCEHFLDSEDVYGDEPIGHTIDTDGIKAQIDTDGDAFVLESPYFTRAAFCSPCAPGACYLTSPCDDGERCYCFGHDWFDGGAAPYPVYSVATGERIEPKQT